MSIINTEMLLAIIPLAIIQIVLMIVALVDISKRKKFKHLPQLGWILISIFINTIGPIIYFIIGRDNDNPDSE